MIRMALKLLLTGLIALIMPLLVHAEEIEETKEETKIVEKEDISIVKSVNPDDPTESCTLSYDLSTNDLKKILYKYLDINGNLIDNGNFAVTDYLKISNKGIYTFDNNWANIGTDASICKYNLNKILIGCDYIRSSNINITSSNDIYIRISIRIQNNNHFYGDDCVNIEEETMIRTQNIEKLLIIGVGILIAIFLTRRK